MPFDKSVVVRDASGATYLRSSAVAKALSVLPGAYGRLGTVVLAANRWAPLRALNDLLYHVVAKNRRRISNGLVRVGLLDSSCRVASASES
jgi:predicted DCC family thiol-disulfide oxidoreductase YuxK